jgi:hypothetical protein
MNIDVEFTIKIRASDTTSPEPCRTILARIMDKLASHPCVLLILREFARQS